MLTLTLENQPSFADGSPVSYSVSRGAFRVGRGSSMEWILPDPVDSLPSKEMRLSRQHFEVLYEDGRYWLRDTSTFGTQIIGRQGRITGLEELKDGMRLRAGRYFIHVSVTEEVVPPSPMPRPASGQPQSISAGTVPGMAPSGFGGASGGQPSHTPVPVGGGWGPAAAAPSTPSAPGAWGGPASQGGSSSMSGPVSTPVTTQSNPTPSAAFPASPGWGPAPSPAAQEPAPLPPLQEVGPQGASATPQGAQPTTGSAHAPPSHAPFAPHQGGGSAAQPGPAAHSSASALVSGLATGLGVDESTLSAQEAGQIGFVLGRCLSICTADVMQLLQDRGSVKSNVIRLERTVFGAEDDNPLKFAGDAGAAIESILATVGHDGSNGAGYYSDALKDVRLHQAALISAIQKALLELFENLSPDAIEDAARAKSAFRMGKGRLWDDYCDRWDDLQDKPNGILDAFLELYSKHYKAAVDGGGSK